LGADTIAGGAGNDTLDGGAGDDTLTGGAGDDDFVYIGGADVITDFNSGNSGSITDGDPNNNDFIDLSAYYDRLTELWADQADNGVLDQSNATDTLGRAVDYSDNTQFGPGEGIGFLGASADNTFFTQDNTGVVCYGAGTLISTPKGDVPIETIKPGDLVNTRDNGPQPVLWSGCKRLGALDLIRNPKLRPIHLSAEVFGFERDLIVSPQHGILLKSGHRGGTETLYRATHLTRLRGDAARRLTNCNGVHYHHLLFANHQIIFAEGMPAESLYPGRLAIGSMPAAARAEIHALFPELATLGAEDGYGAAVTEYSRRKWLPEHCESLKIAV